MLNAFAKSLNRNVVPLISLFVAVIALTYNTQRAEITEENRNIRFASFEILRKTNQLQQLTDHAHYDRDLVRGDPIVGWAHVNYINDLAMVLPHGIVERSEQLHQRWRENFASLGDQSNRTDSLAANEIISTDIAELRNEVREVLGTLD